MPGRKRAFQYSEDDDDEYFYRKSKKSDKFFHHFIFDKISNFQVKVTEFRGNVVLHLTKGNGGRWWCPLRVKDLQTLVQHFPNLMEKVNECRLHIKDVRGYINDDEIDEDQYTFIESQPSKTNGKKQKKKTVLVKKKKDPSDEVDTESAEEEGEINNKSEGMTN